MKILILTRYDRAGASSRYRHYQYIPFLKENKIEIKIEALLSYKYINYLYAKEKFPLFEILISYVKRFFILLRKNKYDIIWLEKEAFPWVPFILEKFMLKSSVKLISDYDDPFFHSYDLNKNPIIRFFLKNKIDDVMKNSNLILVGNEYLFDRAAKNNKEKNIKFFPTVVDTNRFKKTTVKESNKFRIGWIGTPSTVAHLEMIAEPLREISKTKNVEVVFVGAEGVHIPNLNYKLVKWNEQTEVEEISNFDVGIMPLRDIPWARGKCGFKLIQYMACEVPVIGSPVGINKKIIQHGKNGFQATNSDDWLKYLKEIKNNFELKRKMGKAGRIFVEENFSLQKNSNRLIEMFNDVLRDKVGN